ncbi:glycosyltransferase family 2 protein [bacterium]|nr:MAG: glycosyltransferase family 2 protein [bacterium]
MSIPQAENTGTYKVAQEAEAGTLVSVVVGVFNGERYLKETIESVLAQTYSPLELILVNDGSTDSSGTIADEYEHASPDTIRVHHQPNAGISAARNKGVALARGKWIAFLDADDLWLPCKLSLQMEAARRGAVLITAFSETFWSDDVPSHLRHRHAANQSLPHAASAFLAYRDTFLEIGQFNEDSRDAQEWIEWSLQAAQAGFQVKIVPEVLNRRRLHLTNKSRMQEGRLALIKAHLDRQRAAKG